MPKKDPIEATRNLIQHIAGVIDAPFSVRLWDGSMIPLGQQVDERFYVAINDPGAIGTLLRKPTYENLLLHYVKGAIDIHGDFIDFFTLVRANRPKKKLKKLSKSTLLKQALPLFFSRTDKVSDQHEYSGDEVGRKESRRNNKEFIQFHYDISNDFYALFLGKEMQYSCGYFTHPDNSLDQAQHDKLDMICKKLRLKPDERFLDIGCGWGGLVCHAAQHYGVQAHGVTLSQTQFDFTTDKIKRLGLEDRITIELKDYTTLDCTFDKISSIGMFEHIGLANMDPYFRKIKSLLRPGGMLLNHGITRRAKKTKRARRRITPERRLLLKYIFPGSELDCIGNTVNLLEINRFEVHDVEAWREHYALTCLHWYRRLMQRRDEAIQFVGKEKFRMWALYLAGASLGFTNGSIGICQVVASQHSRKVASDVPLTRADLYANTD
jgi:cyclopropane-fatty-acyl-phospholipid synthase